ncbi:hypothetical protein FOYG_16070 [Fusarium oxysporum NRRL 32931]|uniref:Xaa-Pro dipeptidyl-peptidase C-terminal domain-containing protein n=1 Tax=Fusarium oxysporum NRRL 32931 TaxID=660029 RepID=W9HNS3_FUSOX|nr:hypothetical protein FOYG_16070 [Fusarium oxysporum NRRL 32931]
MANVELTKSALADAKRLGHFIQATHPMITGSPPPNRRTVREDGLILDLDISIPLRDGTVVYGNLFRSQELENSKIPVIVNYTVYGKDGATDVCFFPPSCGLDRSRFSKRYGFEGADPQWWCPRGYAVVWVDTRGSFYSEGDKSYYSRDVGLDGYDIVEWLAYQSWCNGKVALYGASGLAMVSWLVAAERPPSLAAIVPIDGMTDIYREMCHKGGMKETQFGAFYPMLYNWGLNQVEDPADGWNNHVFFDEYWQSKIPALEKITCPCYILCSWGDHGIHTRGTINAYYGIQSEHKYLELHQNHKWEWALTDESLYRQKAFLDTFLLGQPTEIQYWPKVRYMMRERLNVGEWRFSSEFPIPETQYTKFFPATANALSQIAQPQAHSVQYDARTGEAAFELPFTKSFQFVGHSKLKIWVEARGGDNLDLTITLRKKDQNGSYVHFPWMTLVNDGPIAFGWLRASRRELHKSRSKPWQPYHLHQRDLPPLKPGEIVPLEIEILPTSCRFRAGESLQVVISGHDYNEYPTDILIPRHAADTNKGTHVIHFGGEYDSHLLLPVVPPVEHSHQEESKFVKMSLLGQRIRGWSDEKTLKEYVGTHASMTQGIANAAPVLRAYTQVPSVKGPKPKLTGLGADNSQWDFLSVLQWATVNSLWGSLQHPAYKASAGSHAFADEDNTIAILSQEWADLNFNPVAFKQRGKDAVMVNLVLAKSRTFSEGDRFNRDLSDRAATIEEVGAGTELLRYVINKGVFLDNPFKFFEGTPFKTADWTQSAALEQFWFNNTEDAVRFFCNAKRTSALAQMPSSFDQECTIELTGQEIVVVKKDFIY